MDVIPKRRGLSVPAHQQIADVNFVPLAYREIGPVIAAAVARRGIPHGVVQHLVNQRVSVSRPGDEIVMLRADELRCHVDGQRGAVSFACRIGQGVVEDLFRCDAGK
ncbi:hypothetical protein D3C80_704330 [compost metagenome]